MKIENGKTIDFLDTLFQLHIENLKTFNFILRCGHFEATIKNCEVLNTFAKITNTTKTFSKFFSIAKLPSAGEDAH